MPFCFLLDPYAALNEAREFNLQLSTPQLSTQKIAQRGRVLFKFKRKASLCAYCQGSNKSGTQGRSFRHSQDERRSGFAVCKCTGTQTARALVPKCRRTSMIAGTGKSTMRKDEIFDVQAPDREVRAGMPSPSIGIRIAIEGAKLPVALKH